MDAPSFQDMPLWASLATFVVAGMVVFRAGARLARQADRLSRLTGISGAAVGLVVLGGITSLPEVATSLTAAFAGAAPLAVNNLVGGVALQILFLAVADVAIGREALTSTVPRADVVAQAAMNVGMLSIVAAAVAAGEPALPGLDVGVGASLLFPAYVACVWVSHRLGRKAAWLPAGSRERAEEEEGRRAVDGSLARLGVGLAASAGLILVAGYILTRSGEAVAEQSGLGASFFGAVFLAGATSLPELSSALAAVRIGRPQLAIGDVLGGNLFNLMLIFLVDLAFDGGPVLATVGPFSIVSAGLASLLSAVLIIGLIERRDRTILRMGWDSATMMGLYGAGLVALYHLRPAG